MGVDLKLYETGTTTPVAPFDLGTVQAGGAESTEKTIDLVNEGDTVATGISIGVLGSVDGGITWREDLEFIQQAWSRVEITATIDNSPLGDIEPQITGEIPVGGDLRSVVNPIPAGDGRTFKFSIRMPAFGQAITGKIKLVVYFLQAAVPLSVGFTEAGLTGVVTGDGNEWYRGHVIGGELVTEDSPQSTNILVATGDHAFRGSDYNVGTAFTKAITAAAGGNEKWVTVSIDEKTNDVNLRETAEVAAPIPVEDRLPPLDPYDALLAYVRRNSNANVVNADITDARALWRFHLETSASSLDVTLSGGEAIAQNLLIRRDFSETFTLAANQTSWIFLTIDGGVFIDDAANEYANVPWGALKLYEITTDGVGVP